MKRNSKIGIVALILVLSIGFAAVATSLIINGVANVSINPADFDIYFSFAKAEYGGTATISDDKKTITYSTKTLTTVGEKAKLDYTVTNNSSNYDADVTVIWNAVDTISGKDYSEYYTVTRTGFESGVETTVEAKTSVDGAIEITLIKPILEEVEIESSMTYDAIPQERTLKKLGSPLKRRTLSEMILRDNVLREDTPDLTTTEPKPVYNDPEQHSGWADSYDDSGSGFYSMNVANGFGGQSEEGTTYYFRGKVENNYVAFGEWPTGLYKGYNNEYPDYVIGQYSTYEECMNGHAYSLGVDYCETIMEPGSPMLWRVVRINEDGTVRLIFDKRITEYQNDSGNKFNDDYQDPLSVYYSNSNVKNTLETWYSNTLSEEEKNRVAEGNYFCESFKVSSNDSSVGEVTAPSYYAYTPNLSCSTDGNGKGFVNNHIALINYDELVLAGGYYQKFNPDYYINHTEYEWWTMSPAGYSLIWRVQDGTGHMSHQGPLNYHDLRPVINIKADTYAYGTGTKDDPYVIILN